MPRPGLKGGLWVCIRLSGIFFKRRFWQEGIERFLRFLRHLQNNPYVVYNVKCQINMTPMADNIRHL